MINRVVLVGRLTRDVELRFTKDQIAVATFTIALDRIVSNRENKVTDFINCTVWRSTAEYANKYSGRGTLVAVDGRLQSRSYEDKTGRRVSVVEVLCDSFQILERRKDRPSGGNGIERDSVEEIIAPIDHDSEEEVGDEVDDNKFQISDDDLPF